MAEKDLDLAKASEIALAMDMATKNTQEMSHPSTSSVSVNVVNRGQKSNKSKYGGPNSHKTQGANAHTPCFRCGGKHAQSDCNVINEKCFSCQKVGHIW